MISTHIAVGTASKPASSRVLRPGERLASGFDAITSTLPIGACTNVLTSRPIRVAPRRRLPPAGPLADTTTEGRER